MATKKGARKLPPIPLEMTLWHGLEWDVPEDDCWVWQGALDNQGYGMVSMRRPEGKRQVMRVHRAIYELVYDKPLTRADTILHLCDNPACANPAHLLRGNSVDNRVDMAVKCRGRFKGLSDNYARFLYEKLKQRFEPADGGAIADVPYGE